MRYIKLILAVVITSACIFSCGKKSETPSTPISVEVPKFNGDSAVAFVQKQVDFGPRIPNSDEHKNAAAWYEAQLRKSGAQVVVQSFKAAAFDGTQLELKNIIASFNPGKQKRILLAAHWDTRPFADKDATNPNSKMDGANDGASGVGILLEIARLLKDSKPNAGVDIILFDGEDYGEKINTQANNRPPQGYDDWWCLGSQYWSKNKHKANYRGYYGIVLDIVGAPNARFFKEGVSMQYAPGITDKVWSAAATLGYSDVFVNQQVSAITDDHYFLNANAQIPTIDIVHYDGSAFGDFHHTTNDNMSVISKRTLEAVGKTVLYVVFNEEN